MPQETNTPSWESIEDILNAAIDQFRSFWWRDQPYHVEVWLEKRALRRIFYPITNGYDVYLCTGGGYQSWSEVWAARARFLARKGSDLKILYFGDLDPSGKDMPRDIRMPSTTILQATYVHKYCDFSRQTYRKNRLSPASY